MSVTLVPMGTGDQSVAIKISKIWVPGTEEISEVGYRRVPKRFLGTDGYRAKFQFMPTPGLTESSIFRIHIRGSLHHSRSKKYLEIFLWRKNPESPVVQSVLESFSNMNLILWIYRINLYRDISWTWKPSLGATGVLSVTRGTRSSWMA